MGRQNEVESETIKTHVDTQARLLVDLLALEIDVDALAQADHCELEQALEGVYNEANHMHMGHFIIGRCFVNETFQQIDQS